MKDIWPTRRRGRRRRSSEAVQSDMFRKSYGEVFDGDERWNSLEVPTGEQLRLGRALDLRAPAAVLRGPPARARADRGHHRRARAGGARGHRHNRSHLARRLDQARRPRRQVPERARRRAEGLQLLRLTARQPRGDDARHVREHPPAQPAGARAPRVASRCTSATARAEMSIYDAAMKYIEAGVPLVVLAGKEYGSGSSRDWAAKGTRLLGVRAVIAQSYERIHRSNLVGMGVLPLQFKDGDSVESLGLTGQETFTIAGLAGVDDDPARDHGQGRRQGVRRSRSGSTRRRSSATTSTAGSSSSCSVSCLAELSDGDPEFLRATWSPRSAPPGTRAGGAGVARRMRGVRRRRPRRPRRLLVRPRERHRRRPDARDRRPHRRDRLSTSATSTTTASSASARSAAGTRSSSSGSASR